MFILDSNKPVNGGTFLFLSLLNNKCLSNDVLHKTNVTSTTESYWNKVSQDYGISETKFRSQYTNQWKSFKNRKYKTDTVLSNETWILKEQNRNVIILWEIAGTHQLYNTTAKWCMLCLNKKLAIVLLKQDITLNKLRHNQM